MIALDHRTAPVPIYTIRSPPPSLRAATLLDDQKSPRTAVVDVIPDSPPKQETIHASCPEACSHLYPASNYPEVAPKVHALSALQLADALRRLASLPLPDSRSVFPWLHGISSDNLDQQDFFRQSPEMYRIAPKTFRGITIVHASDVDMTHRGRLANSFLPEDIVSTSGPSRSSTFRDVDPRRGVGLRNFRIQAVKAAMLSDIVVYDPSRGEHDTRRALDVAAQMTEAQQHFRKQQPSGFPEYSTFVVSDPIAAFEQNARHLIALASDGTTTEADPEFLELEQEQMCIMSKATEISRNVYLGNSKDWTDDSTYHDNGDPAPEKYSVHIRCDDSASIPSVTNKDLQEVSGTEHIIEVLFPSSGSFGNPTQEETKDLVDFCAWIHQQAHDGDGEDLDWSLADLNEADTTTPRLSQTEICSEQHALFDSQEEASKMRRTTSSTESVSRSRKILITCRDGYTETTLLALAYTMYAECLTIDDAWVHLHRNRGRNFYAFPEDMTSLKTVSRALIAASPQPASQRAETLIKASASWFTGLDGLPFSGSFPSRILPHLYLGNLDHASNVQMLEAIGVNRILSVGEKPKFMYLRKARAKPSDHMYIHGIQDDGIDSLTSQITGPLERCLDFIDEGVKQGQVTLVHCRVGVSRSASVCIADVVRRQNMSIEQAYLFVRARRLNVIIQPNLRFMYELMKWSQEEQSRAAGIDPATGLLVPRTNEWSALTSKITRLNQHYIHS